MNTILFILIWTGGITIFHRADFQKACEAAQFHPGSEVHAVLDDYSNEKRACKKVPEKKVTTTIAAYWTAY